jgi:DNA-directed RNA polymerase specialized sigma54-like protein
MLDEISASSVSAHQINRDFQAAMGQCRNFNDRCEKIKATLLDIRLLMGQVAMRARTDLKYVMKILDSQVCL